MSLYNTSQLGFGLLKNMMVLRYKTQIIVSNLDTGGSVFYDNQELPWGMEWDFAKPNGIARNMEEAFRLIDAMPVVKPERLYAVSGDIYQITQCKELDGIDFVPIGPRQPNRAVAHIADAQKARSLYKFMNDHSMVVHRDWVD